MSVDTHLLYLEGLENLEATLFIKRVVAYDIVPLFHRNIANYQMKTRIWGKVSACYLQFRADYKRSGFDVNVWCSWRGWMQWFR